MSMGYDPDDHRDAQLREYLREKVFQAKQPKEQLARTKALARKLRSKYYGK